MDDEALSRTLTARIRSVPGVVGVHPARPVAQVAAEVVAAALALQEPDVLVDVDRDGGSLRVAAGIAVDDRRPAAETLRAVGDRIRTVVDEEAPTDVDLIAVTVRLVEERGGTDHVR